ncbi:MAG: pyridoxal-phosphate dependent enzyme [Ignavibacteria bacterium]
MVTLEDIRLAHERIRPFVHNTPVLTSQAINQMVDANVYFKCENLQKVGAFKARGAVNAVLQLDSATAARGVVTHSSGNHAQALAYAAKLRGIPCTIVMPSNAPSVKQDAVRDYGASIVLCEPTLRSRLDTMEAIVASTGAHPVPPYNDERVIAGQGTLALEFVDQVDNLDVIMAPVGGGGLLGGVATAVHALDSRIDIVGAEPEIAADAQLSLQTGVLQPPADAMTIADGLRTGLGDVTLAHLQQAEVRILTASEDGIREATYRIMERLKVVIEPSAGVTLAVMLENPGRWHGLHVGIVLCGGNIDIRRLPI